MTRTTIYMEEKYPLKHSLSTHICQKIQKYEVLESLPFLFLTIIVMIVIIQLRDFSNLLIKEGSVPKTIPTKKLSYLLSIQHRVEKDRKKSLKDI